jgi:hypothetical protein
MSSVRTARRWIDAGARRSTGLERGPLLLLAAVCAALFVITFALGRVLSPASQAGHGALPRITAAQAHDLLPVRLTAVPPIRPGVRAAPSAPAKPVVRAPTSATVQAPAQAAPAQAIAPVPAAPAPATTTPVAAPAPAKAPEGQQRSAPTSTKRSGGGVSFDSSG